MSLKIQLFRIDCQCHSPDSVLNCENYLLLKADDTLPILLPLFCLGSSIDLQSVNGFMYEGCTVTHPHAPPRRERKTRISSLALNIFLLQPEVQLKTLPPFSVVHTLVPNCT